VVKCLYCCRPFCSLTKLKRRKRPPADARRSENDAGDQNLARVQGKRGEAVKGLTVERDGGAGGLGNPRVDEKEEGTARSVAEEYRIGDEFDAVVQNGTVERCRTMLGDALSHLAAATGREGTGDTPVTSICKNAEVVTDG
jgi:hypothetical protein